MKTNGILQPLLLAAVIGAGFVAFWGMTCYWIAQIGESMQERKTLYETLVIYPDGTPRLRTVTSGSDEVEYQDMDGKKVPGPEGGRYTMGNYLSIPSEKAPLAADAPWSNRIHLFEDPGPPKSRWYFISDGKFDGNAYFVGFDEKSSKQIGFMGTKGFRLDRPPSEELFPLSGCDWLSQQRIASNCDGRLPNPGGFSILSEIPPPPLAVQASSNQPCDVYVVGSSGQLFHADLKARTVRTHSLDGRIRSVALLFENDPTKEYAPPSARLVARTDEALLDLDPQCRIQRRYHLPAIFRGQPIQCGKAYPAGMLIYQEARSADNVVFRLNWVNKDGTYREKVICRPWDFNMQWSEKAFGALLPSPLPLVGLAGMKHIEGLLKDGEGITFESGAWRDLPVLLANFGLACLIAAACAILCYRRQVRFGASRGERLIWTLFVFAFGLPGWVGYRFCRSWPVLEECTECRVRVPRNRESCFRCETDFAVPALKGTEVFA